MKTTQERLAKRLLYLPLDIHEKVLLWLAFRGLKPVSEITVERRNSALYRRLIRQGKKIKSTYDRNSNKTKRVRKWIRDANLFYAIEPGYSSSWHVGKNKDKVSLSTKILRRFDYDSELKSGILFGFPKESAKAYAHNRVLKLGEKRIQMIRPFHSFLKDKYYTPYLFYSIRADRVKEDSQAAKLWADTIRNEVPTLAKWYEKSEAKNRKRESKWINKWKPTAKRDNQTAVEIIAEYSKVVKTSKEIFKKAFQEFSDTILNDFQFASVCYELCKRITPPEKKEVGFAEVLKVGKQIYKPGKRVNIKNKRKNFLKLQEWFNKNK